MAEQFDEGGVRFTYPETWRLEREDNEAGWTVSLHSPDTAFMMVCLREDLPAPAELADAALEALRETYPDLEVEDRVEGFAGQPAIGHDIRFFALDLTNTCWTRSFYTSRGTLLVLCQANDLELEETEPVLRAICKSMQVDQD